MNILVFMFLGFEKNIITQNKNISMPASKMGFKNKFICIFDLKDFSSVNPSFAIPTLSLSP